MYVEKCTGFSEALNSGIHSAPIQWLLMQDGGYIIVEVSADGVRHGICIDTEEHLVFDGSETHPFLFTRESLEGSFGGRTVKLRINSVRRVKIKC